MSNTDVSTDNEVIERSADEPGAFALLFDRHAPAIYRYAAQRLGEGSAEDVIVLFSMRPQPGEILYEILDDAGHPIAEITLETLESIFEAQKQAAA